MLHKHFLCSYDYLKIVNEKNQSFGVYCGEMSGKSVGVTGEYAVITFHSVRNYRGWTGFRIFFRIQENGSKPETIGTIVFNPRHQIRLP